MWGWCTRTTVPVSWSFWRQVSRKVSCPGTIPRVADSAAAWRAAAQSSLCYMVIGSYECCWVIPAHCPGGGRCKKRGIVSGDSWISSKHEHPAGTYEVQRLNALNSTSRVSSSSNSSHPSIRVELLYIDGSGKLEHWSVSCGLMTVLCPASIKALFARLRKSELDCIHSGCICRGKVSYFSNNCPLDRERSLKLCLACSSLL